MLDLDTIGYYLYMEEQEQQDASNSPPSALSIPADATPTRGKEK